MLSSVLGKGSETDRIASNIVTGIGFLGAGAIMREGLTVSGLTTASSIWLPLPLEWRSERGNITFDYSYCHRPGSADVVWSRANIS
jgi:hypothetical protein